MNGIALVPICENLPTPLVDLASAARGYMEESLAAATRKAYASDVNIRPTHLTPIIESSGHMEFFGV